MARSRCVLLVVVGLACGLAGCGEAGEPRELLDDDARDAAAGDHAPLLARLN
jgi:hypothetical protein